MESVPYLGHQIRRWQIGDSTFLAWPEAGARLMRWSMERSDRSAREIIHWPELTALDQPLAKIRGGNPILFPFSARTFDRGDIHVWLAPDGQRRPMPMHGFARQGTFELDRIDGEGFRALLKPTRADHEAYPFDYEFRVAYRFEASALTCEFTLRNLGDAPIPWCAGHHFYFTVPWEAGRTRDDYLLSRPESEIFEQDEKGALIPARDVPPVTTLSHAALVDAIHTDLAEHRFRFGPSDGPEHVDVMIGTQARPGPDQAMVTWTAGPTAPFYCVEPWMGPPNAPEHQRGLEWVPPGVTGRFVVSVAVG